MITKFQKDSVPEYFKAKFIEAFRNEEYEKAVDCLLKYSELTDYPQFHLAMGELYMLMTQDSDDIDLCFLAYREFLMHIRRFPKCEAAYRCLVATEYLRRDYPDVEEYRKWFSKRGVNVVEIFKALSKSGLTLPISSEPVDLYELFLPGELGALDPLSSAQEFETEKTDNGGKKTKIIEFGGNASFGENGKRLEKPEKPEKLEKLEKLEKTEALEKHKKSDKTEKSAARKSKIIDFGSSDIETDDFDDEDIDDGTRAILDDFIQFISTLDDEPGILDEDMLDMIERDAEEPQRSDVIKRAGDMYDRRDYEGALDMLSRVTSKDPQYYYALTLRGVVLLERDEGDDTEQALATLREALRVKPGGALASTLLCQAYENTKRTELIPTVLKNIDNTDFVNGAHVYKAFDLALEYCTQEDAANLIEQYIEEYNLMDMRLIYALMKYNRGDKAEASRELYTLSRINYDDFHYNFFYISSKLDMVNKLPVDTEAPQEVLSAVVENIMEIIESGERIPKDVLRSDLFTYGLEFFFTLEFKNSKKTLKRMFDTLEGIAANPVFEERVRDALVSPYAEPIVKGVILSELFSRDNTTDFLLYVADKHYAQDTVETPRAGYGDGVYRAYGMLLALCPGAAPSVTALADKLAAVAEEPTLTERQKEYYIVKRALKDRGITPDSRLACAMGFRTKAEADRIYSEIDKKI